MRPRPLADDPQRIRRIVFDTLATRSLGAVVNLLGQAGIACAPVKGIVLSRWIYDDVSERPFVDVDLLVPRHAFARAVELVSSQSWAILGHSLEMGELLMNVDRVPVELHAEVGRPDLSRLSTADFLDRAHQDRETFPFTVARIDDVDHFLLLVANVVKDGFTYANAHQPADLERLLPRIAPRFATLIDRATSAAFSTALYETAVWMAEEHGSEPFAALARQLPSPGRRILAGTVRIHRRLTRRQRHRLTSPSGLLGLALATLTPDDFRMRWRGLARVIRRGIQRRLHRDPG